MSLGHDGPMARVKNEPFIGKVRLEEFSPPKGLEAVAVYDDVDAANEAGLAILAMGKPYWTLLHQSRYVLCVFSTDEGSAITELRAVAALETSRRNFGRLDFHVFSFSFFSFGLFGLILIAFFVGQQAGGLLEAGRVDSIRMVEQSEWGRALTALMLHGDSVHLVSNLVAGVGFAFLVARFFGAAAGWLLILLSGCAGNALNAWVHYPDPHFSIGASTAVFGALGLLTGVGLWVAIAEPRQSWSVPRWSIPIFGGVTLLGLIGMGDGIGLVDVAAHISGFLCGGILGFAGAIFQNVFVAWNRHRFWIGSVVLMLIGLAWAMQLY
jgi:membrane associated rhomboid family serine protease